MPAPTTPWVNPGQFTVKLTVNGKSYTQPIVVKQDPRVKTPALAMQQVYTLSKATYYGAVDAQAAARQARALRDQIAGLRPRASGAAADALAALDKKLESLEPTPQAPAEGRGRGGRGGGRGGGAPAAPAGSLSAASAALAGVMNLLQGADVRPTTVQLTRDCECANNGRHDDGEVGGDQGGRCGIDECSIEGGGIGGAHAHDDAGGATSTPQQPAAPAAVQQASASDRADALSEAARRGDAAKVKELLDAGVDVNTKFRYDRMALSFAADRGHVEVVKLLVERGADLNAKDTFYNATALTWAVNPAMGRTPQHADVVKLLLQRGAQGKDQALMGALGDAATVKAILEVGGLSAGTLSDALEAATRRKNQEMVTLLEQAGAKPRPEFKMDAAQLARYTGSYQGTGNAAQAAWTITVADGRLVVSPGGTARLTLIARDQTTFGIAEQPGTTVTFRIDQDKVVGIMVNATGNTIGFTRIGEK